MRLFMVERSKSGQKTFLCVLRCTANVRPGRGAASGSRQNRRPLCHLTDDLREATPCLASPWLHLSHVSPWLHPSHENHARPQGAVSGVLSGVSASPAGPCPGLRGPSSAGPKALPRLRGFGQDLGGAPRPMRGVPASRR